jgi:hypothetical protein
MTAPDKEREMSERDVEGRGAILQALGFFKSVILSGEDWTPDAQRMFDGAVEGVRTLAAERDRLQAEVEYWRTRNGETGLERSEARDQRDRLQAEVARIVAVAREVAAGERRTDDLLDVIAALADREPAP